MKNLKAILIFIAVYVVTRNIPNILGYGYFFWGAIAGIISTRLADYYYSEKVRIITILKKLK